MTIRNYAEQKDSCLEILENGTVSLKYKHAYYIQVMQQILATEAEVGCFWVWTAAPEYNLHCQVFLNTDFLEEAVAKAEVVFNQVVLPELMPGYMK